MNDALIDKGSIGSIQKVQVHFSGRCCIAAAITAFVALRRPLLATIAVGVVSVVVLRNLI